TKIADLREGNWVRIVGTVRALARTLEAPASGRECIAWYAYTTARGGCWESHAVEMIIEDSTGAIVARVNDARVSVEHQESYNVITSGPSDSLTAFVRRHHLPHRASIEIFEGIIVAGDYVQLEAKVVGHAEVAGADGYRSASSKQVLELAGDAEAK